MGPACCHASKLLPPHDCGTLIQRWCKDQSFAVQGQLLWKGPRVKMGLCEGQPALVAPHAASGRAEYFGSLCHMCVPLRCLPKPSPASAWGPASCQAVLLICKQQATLLLALAIVQEALQRAAGLSRDHAEQLQVTALWPCRAERLCHAVAHGGQIAVPFSAAQAFVQHCSAGTMRLSEDSLDSPEQPEPCVLGAGLGRMPGTRGASCRHIDSGSQQTQMASSSTSRWGNAASDAAAQGTPQGIEASS